MGWNLLSIFVMIALSLSGVCAQSVTPNDLTLEKGVVPHSGIDEIYRRFSNAYRKLNPEAVTNLYSDDAFYLSPGGEIQRGRDKIRSNFDRFFRSVRESGGSLSISFRILDRRISGDLAYDVGSYTLTQKRPSGEDGRSSGKFIVVARRSKNGEWQFHVDSYSDLPKPQNSSSINASELEMLIRGSRAAALCGDHAAAALRPSVLFPLDLYSGLLFSIFLRPSWSI
ncbi:MAG: YybH family protein [Pyrinomonadaceae bacterium]